MTMARAWAFGVLLAGQASAHGYDWGRYVNGYAGKYYDGPTDGEFSDSVKRYAGGFSGYGQSYAGRYSQDRVAQAKEYEADQAGARAPTAAALVELPAQERENTSRVDEALAAKQKAMQDAEASVEELRAWDAELKRDLKNKSFSGAAARRIVAKVHAAFAGTRSELERNFSAAMEALNSTSLAAASPADIGKAEHAAKVVMSDFDRLDHDEDKAMHSAVELIRREGMSKARSLRKQASEAARRVRAAGMADARAESKAGARERVYEHERLDAEKAGERLSGRAEELAEKAEGYVERQVDRVRLHLESLVEGSADEVKDVRKSRRHRLRRALELAREARKAAGERIAEKAAEERIAEKKAAADRKSAAEPKADRPTEGEPEANATNDGSAVDAGKPDGEDSSTEADFKEFQHLDDAEKKAEENAKRAMKEFDQDSNDGQEAGQATLLMAVPSRGQVAANRTAEAASRAAEALAAEREASEEAEAKIEELRSWDAALKRDLNENFSAAAAWGIVARAESAFGPQRAELERKFDAVLEALNATSLATARSSDVRRAEHAAEAAAREFGRLDHAEAKAMRSTLEAIRRAGETRTRALWKGAREAARRAYRFGMAAAHAQREAGVEERVYERKQLDAEEASERLLGQAEELMEKAEGYIEKQFDAVQIHLESAMEDRRSEAQAARPAREQRLDRARDLVHKARQAAKQRAAEEKVVQATNPSVFLARSTTKDLGSASVVPLACAALAATSALLALRHCKRTVAIERPLLG
mmetsp:Transcript_47026/g.147356  ORF Transcript_47026/g.147356 Transcript_47026/m.147356 type:complete len:766 (+) Transcript_47026:57-2354(+)